MASAISLCLVYEHKRMNFASPWMMALLIANKFEYIDAVDRVVVQSAAYYYCRNIMNRVALLGFLRAR